MRCRSIFFCFSMVQNYTFKAFLFKIGGAGVFARLGAGSEMKTAPTFTGKCGVILQFKKTY